MKLLFRLLGLLITNFVFLNAIQINDSFRFDAYGNINMISSEKNKDNIKLSGGFQGRYQINDNISVTGQVHIKEKQNNIQQGSHSLENYNTKLKWLYFDYAFKNDITLRVGAFQFPVFKSSQTGDIEYAYTWTNAPLRSYGVFGASDFRGAEVLKKFAYKDFDFLAQLSFGKSTTRLEDGRGYSMKGEVDSLIALTLKTSHELFILNVGYLQAEAYLNTQNQPIQFNPNVDFNMIAIESEIYMNDFTLKSGLIKSDLTNVFPEDLNYYTSLEYNYKDITPYILYSNETINFKSKKVEEIAKRDNAYNRKYSIGTRYDYNNNVAFKFSYTHEISNIKIADFEERKHSSDTFFGTINVVF